MTTRDRQRLVGVHPDLVLALERIFDELDAEHAPLFVVSGLRTLAEQQAEYAKGRTVPGQIVTMKDGVVHTSNHQAREVDGVMVGCAVDCAFISPQPFDPRHPWETYGRAVEAAGLVWGGRWKMVDCPHAELPARYEGRGKPTVQTIPSPPAQGKP